MNGHFGPQPGPTLRRMLDVASLPVRLTQAGMRAALVNFYPPGYFAAQEQRPQHGCFPYSVLAAGLPLNPPGVPLLSPTLGLGYRSPWSVQDGPDVWRRKGAELAAVQQYDLLVFDLWFSDLLGHQGREPVPEALHTAAREYLRCLDALLGGLLQAGAAVVLSSDHGNFENLGVKAHTVARVPFASSGLPSAGINLGQPKNVLEAGRALQSLYGV